jgi:hypothetical protein
MSSKWYCKVLNEELGPILYSDLVEMVRAGTVGEDDYVKREGTANWERASTVVGLFRAAKRSAVQQRSMNRTDSQESTPSQVRQAEPVVEPVPQHSVGSSKKFHLPSAFIGAAFVLIIIGGVYVTGWLAVRNARYPEPRLGRNEGTSSRTALLETIRAVPPEVPSIQGLQPRVPKRIPGLEIIESAYAPTLTADMKTIIFGRNTNSINGYDLQIANRPNAGDPFGPTHSIEACNSENTDSFPSLSPDGLELLFIRFDPEPQLLYSSRDSRTADFSEPIPWKISLTLTEDLTIGDPQFVDELAVKFQLRSKTDNMTEVFYAHRPSALAPFETPRKLLYTDGGAPQFLSANGLRSYYGWDQGLFLAARQTIGESFDNPVLVCDSKVAGEVDGPVWVAPQEDVIFFCSPGIGARRGSAQRLWMIRY